MRELGSGPPRVSGGRPPLLGSISLSSSPQRRIARAGADGLLFGEFLLFLEKWPMGQKSESATSKLTER